MMSQWLPLAGITAFIGVGIALRTVLHHRRFGTWGVLLFHAPHGGQLLRDAMAIVLGLVLFNEAIGIAWRPDRWQPVYWFQPRLWMGAGLMAAGILIMVLAQSELGVMWRIGIDPAAPRQLVRVGLYRVCRNPIFSAMVITLIGFFLLAPTLLSFLALIGAAIGIRGQVAAEERYLLQVHGEDYRRYVRTVGRFVPWMGRRV
jgi:protein-S-isoprenylcysteine O-methyltransferase Ste14